MIDKFIAGSGGGGGKGGGGGSRTPETDPDSLNSRSFGRIIDLLSEGEIGGLVDGNKSIFLDNTPLENNDGTANFDDVIIRTRNGTSNQTVLSGFVQAANIIANPQSGVEVPKTEGGQTFTITDSSVDSVIFLISVPTLQKIKNNGDTLGTEFKFRFQRSLANGGFANILDEQTITGRTADLYQKQYEFDLSGLAESQFPVAFKVKRTSDTDTDFMNGNDADGNPNNETFISHTSKFFVTSHTLVKEQGANLSGTYTHNNGSGGAGTLITIQTNANHNLEVGDSIGCEFTGGTNNKRMTVASVTSAKIFTVQHTQSRNGSGNVTFGKRFNYPDCALVGLRINAEQFNSVPKRSYLIKGIKVKIPTGVTVDPNNGRIEYPNNYVFNGQLGAAQWTTDPAWCLYDLLTSQRYGCGDFISANELDIYSFYSASVYSSELVTFQDRLGNGVVQTITEPRFSLNVNIQTRQDVFKVVNSLCSVFRAMPLYMSGSFSLIQDRAGLNPTFQFTNANVTPEGFSYSGSSSKTRATVIIVKYFDIELRDAAYEQVIDNDALLKYGAITKNINSFGVTSRHQARRLGKWFLTTLATETDVVSFTTTIQAGALITPGQIIEIQDEVKSGVRRGGQITSVSTDGNNNSVIGIDNITDLPTLGSGLSGELTVILPDGQLSLRANGMLGLPIPTNGINTTNKTITVNGRFQKRINDPNGNKPFLDNTRQPNPVYINTQTNQDPNVGSFWVIETLGTSAEIKSQLYKVVAIEEQDDFQYTVTAVLHNESKYAAVEQNEVLEHRDFTNLDLVPASPSDWATDAGGTEYPFEQLYKDKNQVKVRLLIGWKPVLGVNRYELKYRKDKGGFTTVQVQDPTFSIDDINVSKSAGKSFFDLRVRSISGSGKTSHTPLIKNNFVITGKSEAPKQVNEDFAASLDPHLGIVLSWTPNVPEYPEFADLDIRGYVIYEGTYGSGTFLTEINATSFIVPTLPSGSVAQKTYSIKAIDDDGNVSNDARNTTIEFTNPNQPATLTGSFQDDNYILNWSASVVSGNRFAIKEYEIRQGTSVIATTNSTTLTIPVTWSTDQTFKVRARDITGRESTDKELLAEFTKAAAPNISYSYEGSKIRLSWVKPAEGATKIKDYVIKASSTTLSGTNEEQFNNSECLAVDVINSESYLFEVDHAVLNATTPRRFFVAARDVNNNIGNVGRTGIENYPDVTVSRPPAPTNLTAAVRGVSAFVSWNEVPIATVDGEINGLPIAFYKIYRENAGATAVGTADFQQNGTAVTEEVIWQDATQRYFVRAVDINGNDGILQNVDFTVVLPSPVTNLSNEVIDNNVLLRWTESIVGVNQLPIKHYNVYRNTKSQNNLVGQKLGTFTTVFEQVGGLFSYILVPVNTAGNEATTPPPHAVTNAEVNEPPDFVLTDDFQSALTGSGITTVNSFFDAGGLFFCIDSSRTWKQHFDPNDDDTDDNGVNNSTNSPITFGRYGASTVYALPSENTGSFEEILDTGATIASTRIEGTLGLDDSLTIGEGYNIASELFVAPDNGSGAAGTYVSKGVSTGQRINVLGQNFRFIKIKYDFTGANNNDLIKVNESRVKLFLKRKTDQGRVTITGSASGGTNGVVVSMTETFIDVNSIQLSIQGQGSAKYVIYDFKDEPNPNLATGFRIFVFTTTGGFPTDDTVVDFTIRGV